MTKDNVRDLINQREADGNIYLIAVAECVGDDKSQFTVWDNIESAGRIEGERDFMDDIATTFHQQGRWPYEA